MYKYKMHRILILFLLSYVLFSCNNTPRDVSMILDAAGDNRVELEKVIDHYKSIGDKEKLKAAYFLIGNMDDKYALEGNVIRKYDPFFNYLKSLREKNIQILNNSRFIEAKWDSIVSVLGPVRIQDAEIVPDYRIIKADYLIRTIDLAFVVRDSSPWGRKISFDQFCEYVVSYRFRHEPLEDWRSYYRDKYHLISDTIKADSCYQLAVRMHQLVPRARGLSLFFRYPFDFQIRQMEASRLGTCHHICTYESMVMRSAGLPVAIDFVPSWGNHYPGHTWNTLIMENGKPFHYEGHQFVFGQYYIYQFAKVYRKTFGRQYTNFHGHEKEIPQSIRNDHLIDVTPEYTKTLNVSIPLTYYSSTKKKYALICTFGENAWVAQDWAEIRNNKAFFKNMGIDNLYRAMYFEDGALKPASDPFVINAKSEIIYISPSANERQPLLLYRKYPILKHIQFYHERMVKGSFQGSNSRDFKDCVNLYTITTPPSKIETVNVTNTSRFRYVRFSSPFPGNGDIAELEFYGGNESRDSLKLTGQPIGYPEVSPSVGTPYQNAFDGNIDTYFNGYSTTLFCWAGLDLGKPRRITKIRYCPRSDTNFIVPGDRYELCYWKNDEWISMGVQIAKEAFLKYENVPSGGLYLLHNLSRGKEERIFTYEEGKQVFW